MSQRTSLFRLFLLMVPLFFVVVSCSKKSTSKEEASPVVFSLPWQADSGEYEVQNVEIRTLTDPKKLIGKAAKIKVASKYTDDGFTSGRPNFRIIKSGDRFIPGDLLSLQSATVYAHLERLQEIDSLVGIDKAVARPRKIGVATQWKAPGQDQFLKNNAIYDGRTDSLVIVPYDAKDIPIAINAGVIAHEYSHAIFSALIRRPLSRHFKRQDLKFEGGHLMDLAVTPVASTEADTDPDEEKATAQKKLKPLQFNIDFILRASDEGLADFWAWIYTGDDQFMGRSLPSHNERRRLDTKASSIRDIEYYAKKTFEVLKTKKTVGPEAYKLGTEYARFFRGLAHEMGADNEKGRKEMAQRMVKTLNRFSQELIDGFLDYVSPQLLIKVFLQENQDLALKHCDRFQSAISNGADVELKQCL